MNTEQSSSNQDADIVEKLVPSRSAYLSAFVILFLSGIAGGFIGFAMMEVFFPGSSSVVLIIGTCLICAGIVYGVSVITSLGLQASVEWKARKLTTKSSKRPSNLLEPNKQIKKC